MKPVVVKQYLCDALFRLMEKKGFHSITVNELVKVAGVCRASFYRNFLSIENIVDEFYKNCFTEIFQQNCMYENNIQTAVRNIFSAIKLKRKELSLLHRQGLLDGMEKYVFNGTIKQINEFDVLNNRYQPHFFAGASYALIKAWIEFDFEESEDEITDIFFNSLKGYLTLKF